MIPDNILSCKVCTVWDKMWGYGDDCGGDLRLQGDINFNMKL